MVWNAGALFMAHYRLYFMNIRNGHIDLARDLVAADDAMATEIALDQAGLGPMELWCGGRKVRRFEAQVAGDVLSAAEADRSALALA